MPETVTVASKWPHGLHLRTFHMETMREPVMGGGVKEVLTAVNDTRVTIKGTGRRTDDPTMASGFALTHGVDASVWAKWAKDNEQSDLIKNGLVFAFTKASDLTAEARNREALVSGLEPINPESPPQEFKHRIQKATVASSGA